MKRSLKQTFSKFMRESAYRAEMTLYFNFAINVIYAVFKAVCGVAFHSAWIGTLAFYYILLSIMRLLLVKGTEHIEAHKRWKKYCQCGWFLLLFTIVLVGMSILMQRGKESITYPGYLIYGVAAYTFYAVIIAVWNVNKYRKMNDPNFNQAMGIATGFGAFVIINFMAVVMIVKGYKEARLNTATANAAKAAE